MFISGSRSRVFSSLLIAVVLNVTAIVAAPNSRVAVNSNASTNLGVISGFVRDEAGKPIADATVAIFRIGTTKLLRQVRSAADGRFLLRILPGTYTVLAVAQGYNPQTVSEIEVARATQLNYGFKLEKAGSGNTLPENRLDRNNPKWVRRAASISRSIYQNTEGTVASETEPEVVVDTPTDEETTARPGQSVVETFYASTNRGSYAGVNYATLLPLGSDASLMIAAQAGIGRNAPQRFETQLKFDLNDDHKLRLRASAANLGSISLGNSEGRLGQVSFQALDEWRVREGVILVYGVDYSRFIGAGDDFSISPRLGFQYDIDPKTRFRASYTSQADPRTWSREIELEDAEVIFREPVAIDDFVVENGRPVMNKSSRFEFGIERVLDNRSTIEANAFFDATVGRGVGITSLPFDSAGEQFSEFVGNQQGGSTGLRVVYTRRLSGRITAGGGYSFGTGQQLSANGISDPADLFKSGVFHTLYGQIEADFNTGTNVKTIFRLSPRATIFAIDPFQGRLAIYDPGLSVLVTQHLPTLGLPFQAEAVVDARNVFDFQNGLFGEDGSLRVNSHRRALRGGILVRF